MKPPSEGIMTLQQIDARLLYIKEGITFMKPVDSLPAECSVEAERHKRDSVGFLFFFQTKQLNYSESE